uniref:Uncharacterized protein n=1 Tax=Dulem virus 35 TaxID=3145753 RepID=A0AAU8AZU2_9CAUD
MCRFKSGIILKSKIVLAPGANDSHGDLLNSLGIKDDYINASKTFVRVELIPQDGEWWVSPEEHPEKWNFIVDQDIAPDWFDKQEHEKDFRESVCAWWKVHVLVDQKIDELNSGYYRLKRCKVKKLCNDVVVLLNSSQVGEMRENSQIGEMRENSQVGKMWENSQVGKMWGSSQIGEMRGSSQVGEMRENSQIDEMWGNSQVGKMRGSSQIGEMRGNSTARDFKNYPCIKIYVSDNGNFEMVVHRNNNKEE